MKILVLYFLPSTQTRQTIFEHLFSFRNYNSDHTFYYYNMLWSFPYKLNYAEFDAIILHYTILSVRWSFDFWKKHYFKQLKYLSKFDCPKIALPQDEYAHTDDLCRLFQEIGVETVYTCAPFSEYEKLYPKKETGLKHYFTTFPGYLDENSLEFISPHSKRHSIRNIDIGYRARSLPYWLGKHGQIKKELATKCKKHLPKHFVTDISTDDKDVFYGKDWLNFLLNCRTSLGCLGGASMLDRSGEIRKRVDQYVFLHPAASFEQVEKECFQGLDQTLNLFALSPRHFECAMTKTCQVLMEGNYHNVLIPGKHFIEIKKDYSNLKEVFEKISDRDFCEKLAEKTYTDVVLSGKYTYKNFSKSVLNHLEKLVRRKSKIVRYDNFLYQLLEKRIQHERSFILLFRIRNYIHFEFPRKVKKLFFLIYHKIKQS